MEMVFAKLSHGVYMSLGVLKGLLDLRIDREKESWLGAIHRNVDSRAIGVVNGLRIGR